MEDDEILEEEESYVMIELGGILEAEFESKLDKPCKILGLDTETPYMDIGGSVFEGQFEDCPDTYVFFQADGTKTKIVGEQKTVDTMRYVCHTSKKLNLAHSLLNKRGEDPPKRTDLLIHSAEYEQDALEIPYKPHEPNTGVPPNEPNVGVVSPEQNIGEAPNAGVAPHETNAGVTPDVPNAGVATHEPNVGVVSPEQNTDEAPNAGVAPDEPNAGVAPDEPNTGVAPDEPNADVAPDVLFAPDGLSKNPDPI